MFKDEWGMIVNAPEPASPPNHADCTTSAPTGPRDRLWHILLPDEVVSWRRSPRRGAGWQCLLREADTYALFGSFVLPIAIMLLWTHLRAVVLISAVALIGGALTLRLIGRQLDRARILSIKHAAARLRRHETRCGTTISLGQGVGGNYGAQRWESRNALTKMFSGPSDDSPMVLLRAQESKHAPYDLLLRLSRQAASAPQLYAMPALAGGVQ